MQRLTSPTDSGGLPDPAHVPLDRIVRSFDVADEQMGATRYIGHINVNYDRNQIEQLLRSAGVAYVVAPPGPVLVVPAVRTQDGYDLWGDNPWRSAWTANPDPGGASRLPVRSSGTSTTFPACHPTR